VVFSRGQADSETAIQTIQLSLSEPLTGLQGFETAGQVTGLGIIQNLCSRLSEEIEEETGQETDTAETTSAEDNSNLVTILTGSVIGLVFLSVVATSTCMCCLCCVTFILFSSRHRLKRLLTEKKVLRPSKHKKHPLPHSNEQKQNKVDNLEDDNQNDDFGLPGEG
jgi:hypothetical protein